MRVLKLMPDYECFPLWDVTSPDAYEDVDPESLPISAALKSELLEWARAYDRTLSRSDPAASGFRNAVEEEQFWRVGSLLSERLRVELGAEYSVRTWLPSGDE